MNHFIESKNSLFVELDDRNLSRQQTLANQALLRKAQGDLEGALHLYREAEAVSRQSNDAAILSIALGNQAVILRSQGDGEGALSLFKEKEAICRQFNDAAGLATALANQAHLLALQQSRAAEALPLAEEALRIATSRGLNHLASQIEQILKKMRSLPQ